MIPDLPWIKRDLVICREIQISLASLIDDAPVNIRQRKIIPVVNDLRLLIHVVLHKIAQAIIITRQAGHIPVTDPVSLGLPGIQTRGRSKRHSQRQKSRHDLNEFLAFHTFSSFLLCLSVRLLACVFVNGLLTKYQQNDNSF